MSKIRLATRKQMIEQLASQFDTVYEQLVKREESLFEDQITLFTADVRVFIRTIRRCFSPYAL